MRVDKTTVRKIICSLLLLLTFDYAKGQGVKAIEDTIQFYFKNIEKYSLDNHPWSEGQDDSLDRANDALRDYLNIVLNKQPATLTAEFSRIRKLGMMIATSQDKKFRIYSWDDEGGGTMRGHYSLLQYKIGPTVNVQIIYPKPGSSRDMAENRDAPGEFYYGIHDIISKGQKYYLVSTGFTGSSALHYIGIKCFTIENGKINDSVKLFRTKNEMLNCIDVEIDYTVLKSIKKEPEIYFSDKNRKLYVPLIKNHTVTSRYLLYEFDGSHYNYKGTSTFEAKK